MHEEMPDPSVQLGEQSILQSEEARRLRAAKHLRPIRHAQPVDCGDIPVVDNDPNEVLRGILELTKLPKYEK